MIQPYFLSTACMSVLKGSGNIKKINFVWRYSAATDGVDSEDGIDSVPFLDFCGGISMNTTQTWLIMFLI